MSWEAAASGAKVASQTGSWRWILAFASVAFERFAGSSQHESAPLAPVFPPREFRRLDRPFGTSAVRASYAPPKPFNSGVWCIAAFSCASQRSVLEDRRKSREISLEASNQLEFPCGISIKQTATKSRTPI